MSRLISRVVSGFALAIVLLISVAGGAAAMTRPAADPNVSDIDSVAAVCVRAGELITDGLPKVALALINAVREGGGSAQANACETQWLQATVATLDTSSTEGTVGGMSPDQVCTVATTLKNAKLYDEALAVIDGARAAAVKKIAAGEKGYAGYLGVCETERTAIKAAQAADADATTEAVGSAWNDFVATSLKPLATAGLFAVGLWLIILIVARLSARLWSTQAKSSRLGRHWAGITGAAAALSAPVVVVAVVAAQSIGAAAEGAAVDIAAGASFFEANHTLLLAFGVVAVPVALSIVSLSRVFATRRRVRFDIRGASDDDAEFPVIAELQAIVNDMGGAPARGLEVPIGPDVADLDADVLNLVGVKGFGAVIQTVWRTISSISPWNVEVSIDQGGASASYRISRNGHLINAGQVETTDDRGILAKAVNATSSQRIGTVIVARLIAELAKVYPSDWGEELHGATDADGIALQYLATKWHSGFEYKQTGIELLARALDADPANKSAHVALWNLQYRDRVTKDEIETYNTWLIDRIDDEIAETPSRGNRPAEPKQLARNELLTRLLTTQASVARNRNAIADADADARASKKTDVPVAPSTSRGAPPTTKPEQRTLTDAEAKVAWSDIDRARVLLGMVASRPVEGLNARRAGVGRVNLARLMASIEATNASTRDQTKQPHLKGVDMAAFEEAGTPLQASAAAVSPSALISDPAEGSPDVAYSLACHIVCSHAEADGDRKGLFGPGEPVPRLLATAFVDHEMRRWAGVDPELTPLRQLDEFNRLIGNSAPAPVPGSDADGKKLYIQAQKLDRLDGYAEAAARFVAGRGLTDVEQLAALKGSPSWDRLAYELYRDLVEHHGFVEDPKRVHAWLGCIADAEKPADDKTGLAASGTQTSTTAASATTPAKS